MKSFAALALFGALVAAGSVDNQNNITTTLTHEPDTTTAQLSITNTGNETLRCFVPGSILDDAPVEKVVVSTNGERVPFEGVRLRIAPPSMITNESYMVIEPQQTVDRTIDIAELHDLSSGGDFNVTAKGGMRCTTGDSTNLTSCVPFKSNTLHIKDVNGTQAAITRRDFHAEAKRVADAARAVMLDDKKTMEFFKTTDAATRRNISIAFSKVSNECGTRLAANQGTALAVANPVSKLYCTDVYNSCRTGVLAYTLPSQNYMVNCPLYFSALPSLTSTCHAQDQSTTTLHEMTHLTFIKGTLDWGVYGYTGIRGLTAAQNYNHADTYCLFANSVNIGKTC
uniref:deuterolysin n=1 Tax=Colletotrichum fructicola (strain Nara gc5) TaxID=1213859 RepID=L2GE83_COLFN